MYCPNCGNELPDKEKFCSKCGNKLIYEDEEESSKENKSDEKRKTTPVIIWSAIAIIALAVLFFSLTISHKKSDTENSSELDSLINEEEQLPGEKPSEDLNETASLPVEETTNKDETSPSILSEGCDEDLLIYGNGLEYAIWEQEYQIDKNKEISLDLNNDGELEQIIVGMDTPNGQRVTLFHKDYGINLLYDSSIELGITEDLFDEFGTLSEGCMMQVVAVDFDNDGEKEIVIAIGDGLTTLGVSVMKIDYSGKNLSCKEIGYFEGQGEISIENNKNITIPFGGQGLFEEYTYKFGKFVKVEY